LFFGLLARFALAQTASKGDEELPLDKPYETVEEAREACRREGLTPTILRQMADDLEEDE
jgi:hypothetical protein